MKPLFLSRIQAYCDGHVQYKDILIDTLNTIHDIGDSGTIGCPHDAERIDGTDLMAFPLLIDAHVHFREPGLTHKGTMKSETTAALKGGVGTVIDMPNTIPPTCTIDALKDKVERASKTDGASMHFFFGATDLSHLLELKTLYTDHSFEMRALKQHCRGLKIFFDHSTGNQRLDSSLFDMAFSLCKELKIPIVAHCEDPRMNEKALTDAVATMKEETIELHSVVRPPESEVAAIKNAIDLVKKHGTQLHIAHLTTRGGVELVRQAKKDGLPVSAEVTPHHLFLTTDDYAVLGTRVKMNPPLRTEEHRQALWEGIADGTIEVISTDHAPHTMEEKMNPHGPLSAPSGVPGVETMLPLLLTVASGTSPHPRGRTCENLSYEQIIELCFENPNRLFQCSATPIEKGAKAHIALIKPQEVSTIYASNLITHCGWTPYEGWNTVGVIERIVR